MDDLANRGQTLHREFVGMLFALAIAEVAVRLAQIANAHLDLLIKAPALMHLVLAATIIAASWVGWGQSKYSFSNVKHVFTKDFVELLVDVWLVCVYFFIVQGAEGLVEARGGTTIFGSAAIESLWVMVMFATYVVWDVLSKWKQWQALAQRTWGTVLCAGLSVWAFSALKDARGVSPVIWADLALVALVLLFRATKTHDLSTHTARSWSCVIVLAIGFAACLYMS